MTVIVVAKLKDKVVVGSDTRVTVDSDVLSCSEIKVIKIKGRNVAGAAGPGPVTEALLELQGKEYDFTVKTEVLRFARDYFKTYMKLHGADEAAAYVIVACPTKAWYIHTRSEAYEVKEYYAIGTGGPFARGAMAKEYSSVQSIEELKDLVKWGLTVACKFDAACGEPFDIEEI